MPRPCSICTHEKRDEIDRSLIEGVALRNIAKQYGVSHDALHRHKKNHLSKEVQKTAKKQAAKREKKAVTLLERLVELQKEARNILDTAKGSSPNVALSAIRELSRLLELEAKLVGELQNQRVNVNILQVNSSAVIFLQKKHPQVYVELRDLLRSEYDEHRS